MQTLRSRRLDRAIADGDLDELIRLVDQLSDDHDWDGLVDLRDRARRAFHETGRQLWPAASNAEYRLALEGPADRAAQLLVEGAGHFALGPLAEVVASTHTWAALAPHAPSTPAAALCAHERVVRGEVVSGEHPVLDLPLQLEDWEPAYALATYHAHRVEVDAPPVPQFSTEPLARTGARIDDSEVTRALGALVDPWVVASNGVVATVAVEGTAEEAVAALVDGSQVGWADVDASDALAVMAWAGASGGAHGRRRGAAMGRFGAWWAAGALLDASPFDPNELRELRWCRWQPQPAPRGWTLHLAIEDPADGLAWAIAATDHT